MLRKLKAPMDEGWQVHITNVVGHQYGPDEFDQLLSEKAFLS